MAWTTIESSPGDLASDVTAFAGESSVGSIDSVSLTSHGQNQVVALVEYTEA